MTPDLALRLRAGNAGSHARTALSGHGTGRIHAVFAKVFYIEIANRLACITAPGVEMGPLNIALQDPAPDWNRMGLAPGQKVHRLNTTLHFAGRLAIDIADAGPWHPPKPQTFKPENALATLRAVNPCPPREGLGQTILTDTAPTGAKDWLTANLAGKTAPFTWARQLIGRGPGLTPSGDDFLGGIMIALTALGHGKAATQLWHDIRDHARINTNAISCALLAAAATGLGSASLHAALNAFAKHDHTALTLALARIDGIGHSSGWDALAGVVLTLRANAELQGT